MNTTKPLALDDLKRQEEPDATGAAPAGPPNGPAAPRVGRATARPAPAAPEGPPAIPPEGTAPPQGPEDAGQDEEEPEAPGLDAPEAGPGVFPELGALPAGTPITEDGLARLLGKGCRESIKRAVERGELPRPVRLMGKNTWTAGAIVRHLEARLDAEARRHFGPGGRAVQRI